MKKLYFIIGVLLSMTAISCTELPYSQTPTNNVPPSTLSNVVIEPMPGGAKITYDLPAENDISYVKAEYYYKGEKRVVRSSVYNNFLIIEGLGSVEPVEVSVYLVNHSESVSPAVTKTFTPTKPPIESIFESLNMFADFGGVTMTWENPMRIEIGLTVYIEDENGIMREDKTQYSLLENGLISFRGYDTIDRKFAVKITDKWNNVSGLKEARIMPLFEKLLDKTRFYEVGLPGDNTSVNNNRPLRLCWDNSRSTIWHTVEGAFGFPMYFTIDLGATVKFSRMRLWAREGYYYRNHNLRAFEVWGAKTVRQGVPNDYWTNNEWKNDWEQLGDFEIIKPSGGPSGTDTNEDKAFQDAGFGFTVPIEKETLKYLRFVVKTTWTMGGAIHMAEFDFYGDDR